MKRAILIYLLLIIVGIVQGQTQQVFSKFIETSTVNNRSSNNLSEKNHTIIDQLQLSKTMLQIDSLDTVFFDLANAVITGNYIDIPVSIISDDSIDALDFSLKYNQTNLIYDSIIDLTNYLQALAFYNPNDSTIRFTSNSFQQYSKNVPLVNIRLDILGIGFNTSDLWSIKVYLKGQKCSIKLFNQTSIGFNEISENTNSLITYPNPCNHLLNLKSIYNSSISIFDPNGKEVYANKNVTANSNLEINTEKFSPGIYLLRSEFNQKYLTRKIIVE